MKILLELNGLELEAYRLTKVGLYLKPLLLSYLRSVLFSMAFNRLKKDSAFDVFNEIVSVHGCWNEKESKELLVEIDKLQRKRQKSILDTQLSMF